MERLIKRMTESFATISKDEASNFIDWVLANDILDCWKDGYISDYIYLKYSPSDCKETFKQNAYEYCVECGDPDDCLYPMYEIDDLLCGKSPSDIISMITSDFNGRDDYFYFTNYGMESCEEYDVFDHYKDCIDFDMFLHFAQNNGYIDDIVEELGIEDEDFLCWLLDYDMDVFNDSYLEYLEQSKEESETEE